MIVPVDVAYPDEAAEAPEAEAAVEDAEAPAEAPAEVPTEDTACCDVPCTCASDEAAPPTANKHPSNESKKDLLQSCGRSFFRLAEMMIRAR